MLWTAVGVVRACVECMRRIVQCLAEQPVIRLLQQLVKVREIRGTVAAALAASQKRVDSLKISRGYEASPCGRRVLVNLDTTTALKTVCRPTSFIPW